MTFVVRLNGGPELILDSFNDEPFGGEDANGIGSIFDMVFFDFLSSKNNQATKCASPRSSEKYTIEAPTELTCAPSNCTRIE